MNRQDKSKKNKIKSMRFSRTFFWVMLLFIGSLCFVSLIALKGHSDSKARYLKLVYGDLAKVQEVTNSVQNRAKVQKQIFFSNKGENYELLLNASQAELFLTKSSCSMEIAERMHGVECNLLNLSDQNKKNLTACSIKADYANYSTKQVMLEGNVHIQCAIGTLSADSLIMRSSSENGHAKTHTNFDHLELIGNVEAKLNEGGRLIAERAFLNLTTIDEKSPKSEEIHAFSHKNEFLNEKSEKNSGHHKANNWTLKSKELNIELLKDASHLQISEMQAKGKVSFAYEEKMTAFGEYAVYRQKEMKSDDLFNGIVTLLPLNNNLCLVTSANTEIYAAQIDVDTLSKECIFNEAKGCFFNANKKDEKVSFSSDKLIWNASSDTLVLSGNNLLTQEGIGQIKAFEDVKISLMKIEGKTALHVIETDGEVSLDYIDSDTSLNHTLKSYGSLKIDHQKMSLKLMSPKDIFGHVILGKQIYFEDVKGDILADRAFLKYDSIDKTFKLDRIVLEGDVKITNRLAVSDKDKTLVKQYILAERVDFLPENKEMIFKAPKGERVLLFDEANDLQVSARALKIIREKATKKESLEGLGDVRLSFAENEFQKIRNYFNQDKELKKKETLPNRF